MQKKPFLFEKKRHWLLIPGIFISSFTGDCGPEGANAIDYVKAQKQAQIEISQKLTAVANSLKVFTGNR
jgi:hypothetical protein